MKGKFSVTVLYRMSGICSTLETNHHVGFRRKGVGDLSLSLVSPVSAYNCFYHNNNSLNVDLCL